MDGAARVRIGQLSLPSRDPGTKAVRGGARGGAGGLWGRRWDVLGAGEHGSWKCQGPWR